MPHASTFTRTHPACGSGISRSTISNAPFACGTCTTRIFSAMTLQSSCPLKNARPVAAAYLPRRSVAKAGDRRLPRANRLRTFHPGDAGIVFDRSAAGFRLCYVTPDLFDVGADNGANETAAAIVNVNLRDRVDVVLPRHRRVPIDDVDLAQRNLRIGSCHLLQAWRDLSTRAAPVRIKINNRYVAECQMPCDVHLRAVTDHFDWLTALRDESSSGATRVLLVSLRFFGQFPS